MRACQPSINNEETRALAAGGDAGAKRARNSTAATASTNLACSLAAPRTVLSLSCAVWDPGLRACAP